jgi:hypothetical protein
MLGDPRTRFHHDEDDPEIGLSHERPRGVALARVRIASTHFGIDSRDVENASS